MMIPDIKILGSYNQPYGAQFSLEEIEGLPDYEPEPVDCIIQEGGMFNIQTSDDYISRWKDIGLVESGQLGYVNGKILEMIGLYLRWKDEKSLLMWKVEWQGGGVMVRDFNSISELLYETELDYDRMLEVIP